LAARSFWLITINSFALLLATKQKTSHWQVARSGFQDCTWQLRAPCLQKLSVKLPGRNHVETRWTVFFRGNQWKLRFFLGKSWFVLENLGNMSKKNSCTLVFEEKLSVIEHLDLLKGPKYVYIP
jgi:hypothetical protein